MLMSMWQPVSLARSSVLILEMDILMVIQIILMIIMVKKVDGTRMHPDCGTAFAETMQPLVLTVMKEQVMKELMV